MLRRNRENLEPSGLWDVITKDNHGLWGNFTATPGRKLNVLCSLTSNSTDCYNNADSGGFAKSPLCLQIVDSYGQQVKSESSSLAIAHTDDEQTTVSGNIAKFTRGAAQMDNLVITKSPGSSIKLRVTSPIDTLVENEVTIPLTLRTCDADEHDSGTVCLFCLAGKYWNNQTGSLECQPCPAGQIPNDDASACRACPAGKYNDEAGAEACDLCSDSSVATDEGSTKCTQCHVEDGYTSNHNHTDCDRCLKKYYWDANAEACLGCPLKYVACESGSLLSDWKLKEGLWRSGPDSTNVYECRYGANGCSGGKAANGSSYCNEGYIGALCATCDQRYFFHWGEHVCLRCGTFESHVATILIWAGLLGILLLFLGVSYGCFFYEARSSVRLDSLRSSRHATRARSRASTVQVTVHKTVVRTAQAYRFAKHLYDTEGVKVFIIIVTFQVVYNFTALTSRNDLVEYPDPAKAFANLLGVSNFQFFQYIPIECMLPRASFYTRLAVKTLGPLIMLGCLWLRALVYIPWKTVSKAGRSQAVHQTLKWTLIILELILPSISTTIADAFSCTTYDDGCFLQVQLTIACDDSPYRRSWKTFAILMILIYPVGVNLGLFGLLHRNWNEISNVMKRVQLRDNGGRSAGLVDDLVNLEPGSVSAECQFLAYHYEIFGPNYWWFGVFSLVIRILQTSVLSFYSRTCVQATFATTFTLVAMCVQSQHPPYLKESDSLVSYYSTWILFMWLHTLLLIEFGVLDVIPRVLIGTVLVFVSLMFVFISLNSSNFNWDDAKDISEDVNGMGPPPASFLGPPPASLENEMGRSSSVSGDNIPFDSGVEMSTRMSTTAPIDIHDLHQQRSSVIVTTGNPLNAGAD